jgi:RHS repeat-associated protein
VAAYLRLTDVIYPNGRDVEYGYGTTGSTDDVLGQVATIAGSDGTYAAYTYLGVGTIVTENYQQPQVKLDYTDGSGQITGLDRFGRVVDQVWSDYGNSTTVDEFKYGYDMSGNVAWKENVVSRGQPSPVYLDELYTYNGLDELTALARGELNTTQSGLVSGTQDYSQSWTLDGLGNWSSFDNNGATQTRQVDQSNEITSITGDTQTPAYDLAGNMTTMPQPGDATNALTCVYDAWDRLVQVSDTSGTLAQYQYDGADRLVSETASGTTTYSFYAGQSVIETRVGGTAASNVKYQYVWSLRGDAIPILRDTYSGGTLQSASRIYYTTDANDNVTALIGQVSGTWVVIERYVYDAYGTVTVYNSTWTTALGGYSSSTVGNTLMYAGLSVDPATGLQHADFRWYNSATATWTSTDPAQADINLYRYCGNNSITLVDPSGLDYHHWLPTLGGVGGKGQKSVNALCKTVKVDIDDFTSWLDGSISGGRNSPTRSPHSAATYLGEEMKGGYTQIARMIYAKSKSCCQMLLGFAALIRATVSYLAEQGAAGMLTSRSILGGGTPLMVPYPPKGQRSSPPPPKSVDNWPKFLKLIAEACKGKKCEEKSLPQDVQNMIDSVQNQANTLNTRRLEGGGAQSVTGPEIIFGGIGAGILGGGAAGAAEGAAGGAAESAAASGASEIGPTIAEIIAKAA